MLGQQTLGGITGTITDASGSTVPDASVTAVEDSTHLTRTATSNSSGTYAFVNLPIGSYTLTYTRDGFDSSKYPGINVQADRTVTLNVSLKVGTVSTSVEVEATPLMNATDTTNGYVLDKAQIEDDPALDRQLYRAGDSLAGRQRRTSRRHRRQQRPGQRAHLGQRPARHLEQLPAERRRRQQPIQRQEHQPGWLGARHQQHWRRQQSALAA